MKGNAALRSPEFLSIVLAELEPKWFSEVPLSSICILFILVNSFFCPVIFLKPYYVPITILSTVCIALKTKPAFFPSSKGSQTLKSTLMCPTIESNALEKNKAGQVDGRQLWGGVENQKGRLALELRSGGEGGGRGSLRKGSSRAKSKWGLQEGAWPIGLFREPKEVSVGRTLGARKMLVRWQGGTRLSGPSAIPRIRLCAGDRTQSVSRVTESDLCLKSLSLAAMLRGGFKVQG